MCFNKELTLCFTIFSAVVGGWILSGKTIWKNVPAWRLRRLSACFFFFSFMEFIQWVQYVVIDHCDNSINKIFTAFGWLHICFQPLFSNYAMSAMDLRNLRRQRDKVWVFIHHLCIAVGIMMGARMILPLLTGGQIDGDFLRYCTEKMEGSCGPKTCTTTGKYHLQWSFKMLKPSYAFPNIGAHCVLMFVVPLLMKCYLQALILFITGPLISMFFKVGAGERASIWCFFSSAETFLTTFTQLYILYLQGKNKSHIQEAENEYDYEYDSEEIVEKPKKQIKKKEKPTNTINGKKLTIEPRKTK